MVWISIHSGLTLRMRSTMRSLSLCGTPPAIFELGNLCLGFLQRIGLRLGAVGGRGLLGLGTVAFRRLLLELDVVAPRGLLLRHDGSPWGELGVDDVVGVVAGSPARAFRRTGGSSGCRASPR